MRYAPASMARTPAPHRRLALTLCLLVSGCDAETSRGSGTAPGPADAAPTDAAPRDAEGREASVPADAAAGMDQGTPDAAPPDARVHTPAAFEPTEATRAYCPRDDDAVEARITDALLRLPPAEKVALMHGAAGRVVNGAWLVAGNARLGLPGLRMLDGPRGVSAFTGLRATAFPVAMMRGATWDPALEERVGRAMAREIRAAGADTLLAPTVNILRHPRWGRAQETYSEDTMHLGEMGVAFIRGVQAEGVLASVKHLAANSIEDSRHRVDVQMDQRTLREVYLPHFRRAVVDARAASVMSAYNRLGGLFCDLNHDLLTNILKNEWGFAGFVESDWFLGTHASVESVRAGLDVEMPAGLHYAKLTDAMARGEIDEAEIDASVRRILRAQLCYGLDERTPAVDDTARETPEHLSLAREVARRGIVLLRNTLVGDAPALPLSLGAGDSIAVLGRNADVESIGDLGSSQVLPTDVITAVEGLRARAGEGVAVTRVEGTGGLDAAGEATVRAARAAIIVTGLGAEDEGESDIGAGDRERLALAPDEVALIRAVAAVQPRTIVILEGGAAILTAEWDAAPAALLFAFYPGAQGGHALADVIFGDHAPSGRLPFSIPVAEADLPPFDSVSDTVTYGYLHGYRYLERAGVAARFPFGFGLSYTRFDYADLRLSSDRMAADGTIEATVHVSNVGERAGVETVELYVAALGSSVERAPQDLRAFSQVELGPGEARDVVLSLPAADLAYWDEAAHRFVVEPLEYELRVGSHAADPRLVGRVRVTP